MFWLWFLQCEGVCCFSLFLITGCVHMQPNIQLIIRIKKVRIKMPLLEKPDPMQPDQNGGAA